MAKKAEQINEEPLQFDTELLLGELRDYMLLVVKRHVDWPKLSEKKQAYLANDVEQACRRGIREVVRVVHARNFGVVPIAVSGMKQTKDGLVEAKFTCPGTQDNVLAVFGAGNCSMVLASAEDFMGAQAVEIMKDQPDLMDAAAAETVETDEARTLRENGERVEAGIKPLDETQAEQVADAAEAGVVVDNETGEVLDAPTAPKMPRGHRGRKALPAPGASAG